MNLVIIRVCENKLFLIFFSLYTNTGGQEIKRTCGKMWRKEDQLDVDFKASKHWQKQSTLSTQVWTFEKSKKKSPIHKWRKNSIDEIVEKEWQTKLEWNNSPFSGKNKAIPCSVCGKKKLQECTSSQYILVSRGKKQQKPFNF